jgi:hypothetical protein
MTAQLDGYISSTMIIARVTALFLAFALFAPLSALGDDGPHQITNFSQGALLGEIVSTAQLQNDFSSQYPIIAQASEKIGLSPDDLATVRAQIRNGQARYVELPRHLNAMAGERGGVAFSTRNVTIPAGVHGWEVDIQKSDATLLVYIPNRCGNISYLRVPKRRELAAMPSDISQPLMLPAAPQTIAVLPPVPVPSAQPIAFAPAPLPIVAHTVPHLGWLAAIIVPLVPVLFHGGGGNSPAPVRRGLPTPAPIHTICPPPPAIH